MEIRGNIIDITLIVSTINNNDRLEGFAFGLISVLLIVS